MSSRKQPGVAFWATVVVVATFVTYPLSAGPAGWAASRGIVSQESLMWLYYPIIWLIDDPSRPLYGSAIGNLWEWYVGLWR
jgi:hypothetical protein